MANVHLMATMYIMAMTYVVRGTSCFGPAGVKGKVCWSSVICLWGHGLGAPLRPTLRDGPAAARAGLAASRAEPKCPWSELLDGSRLPPPVQGRWTLDGKL